MKKFLLVILALIVMAGGARREAGAVPASCFSEEIADIESHWGREDMTSLARMGVMAGYPETVNSEGGEITRFYFKPDKKVTRAEFAVILAGALGLEGVRQAGAFADGGDIPRWAEGSVGALHKRGILKGFPRAGGGVDFKPGSEVTRAELAAMFAAAVKGYSGEDRGPGFLDVQPGSWYAGAVERAYALGVIRGRSDGVFAPLDVASRAEVAAMTVRLLERDAEVTPPDSQLAGVVKQYYESLPAALGGGDAAGLLALADGGFYLGLTRGGAGLWENIPGLDNRLTVSPGQPAVAFKSGRLARLRCVSAFSGQGGQEGETLAGEVVENFYLRRSGEAWKIYHVEVEDVSLK